MIDSVQAVLLVVIVLLTLLLLVLGVQIFFILKGLRTTVARTNKILSDTEAITQSVSEPMTFLSSLLFSSKSLSTISKILRRVRDVEKEDGE
jgi:hypothetical protein